MSLQVTINQQQLKKELKTAIIQSKAVNNAAKSEAKDRLSESKADLLEEFDNHPVTLEIENSRNGGVRYGCRICIGRIAKHRRRINCANSFNRLFMDGNRSF